MSYNPAVPPVNEDDLLPYLNEEFFRVAVSFNPLLEGLYQIHYKLPTKVKPGLVLYFAAEVQGGGSLEGLYRYDTNGVWIYIG